MRKDDQRVLGSVEFFASGTYYMSKAVDPNSSIANFALLGGLFASLYIMCTIIMAFFRPWLLHLELVI